MKAAEKGHTEIVRLLLEKGADVNIEDVFGLTALQMVKFGSHTDIVQMLESATQKADKKAGAKESETVASNKNTQSFESVSKHSEDKNDQLLQAVKDGNLTAVQTLLANGADVNAKDDCGIPALWLAASHGYTEVVKLLLEKGADINAKNNDGVTALMMAAGIGHTEIAKLLLEKGADVNAKTNDGQPVLIIAATFNDHTKIIKFLLERVLMLMPRPPTAQRPCLWHRSKAIRRSSSFF